MSSLALTPHGLPVITAQPPPLVLTIGAVVEDGKALPLALDDVVEVRMRERLVVRVHVDGEVVVVMVRVPLRRDVRDGHVIADRLHVTG